MTHNKPAIAVYTLGCKLNQLESESIADAFSGENFPVVLPDTEPEETADSRFSIFILNTCTVTSKSEQKARRIIRKVLRVPQKPVIIVTGCYAQMEKNALEALDNGAEKRLFVIPGGQKNQLLELPQYLSKSDDFSADALASLINSFISSWAHPAELHTDASFSFAPRGFTFHSRAFLKIQDGCNNQCAYCRVHLARGKSRSLDSSKALAELRALEQKGYAEVVLSGVNISQYNASGGMNLSGLLEYLLCKTEKINIRLSSIEPDFADTDGDSDGNIDGNSDSYNDEFLKIVAHNRIRPHFHISLQSASAAVLRRMKRFYDPDEVLARIKCLRAAKDDPFLGCDIITGFPGETNDDFEQTFDFCKKANFAGIHAFPFSRRPGTDAWNFKDRVSEKEAGRRAGMLIELAKTQRQDYIGRWIGRETEAVLEESKTPGISPALTANYLRLLIYHKNGRIPEPGRSLRCQIVKNTDKDNPIHARFDAVGEIIV